MAVVAVITISFIIVGDINFLAPIVTMPFLLTYACIDYSYFALAQTFDIQEKREERFRIQASSPLYESRRYGAIQSENNDLDLLFPDRVRHKNLKSPPTSQKTSPQHVPFTSNSNDRQSSVISNNTNQGIQDGINNRIENNDEDDIVSLAHSDDEPIAPTRPPIHSKTKNWYSGFCNRWASLVGVRLFIICFSINSKYNFKGLIENCHNVAC